MFGDIPTVLITSVRPTLMGKKNLYENGPNPFFLIRDQKFGQADSYGNEKLIYKNGPNRQVWVRSAFSLN